MKKRILVIDDEKVITDLLKQYLEPKDYEVFIAHNGDEGLTLLKRNPPDLVVLDINMPKKDGLVFYKEISTDHGQAKLPVLVMTGRHELREVFEGLEVDAFITKPFEMKDFLKEVDRILRNTNRANIFIIDSLANPHAIQIATVLEHERYKVVHVENLAALVQFASICRPDFIFLEYVRQDMHGEDLIQALREVLIHLEQKNTGIKKIPIFVYSYSGMDYEERSLKAGAYRYLGRPKHYEDIVTALREFEMSGERGFQYGR